MEIIWKVISFERKGRKGAWIKKYKLVCTE